MTMLTVGSQTRTAAYDLVIDLEWNLRYYTAKADSLQRWAFGMRFTILAGVVIEGAIAYPMSQTTWGWLVLVGLGAVLGGLAVWDALNHYARDSGILKLTALACDELKTEAQRLLRAIDTGRIETEEAESMIESIYHRWGKATDKVLSAFDNRLSERCESEAIKVMENRYATTG